TRSAGITLVPHQVRAAPTRTRVTAIRAWLTRCKRPQRYRLSLTAARRNTECSSMFQFKLRIGGKLAAFALAGLAMGAGMLANQQISNRWNIELNASGSQYQATVADALVAARAIRSMQIANRDMKEARSPEDVDKAPAYLRAQTEEATKRLQSA